MDLLIEICTLMLSGAGTSVPRKATPPMVTRTDGPALPLSEIDLPPPPLGSRFSATLRDNEVVVTCPTQRARLLPTLLLAICGYQVPLLVLACLLSGGIGNVQAGNMFIVTTTILVTMFLGFYFFDHLRWITLTTTRSRLLVATTTLVGTRYTEWDRSTLDWMRNERTGLDISGDGQTMVLFGNQTTEERRWLAEVLSQTLRLEITCPPDAAEVAVIYRTGTDGPMNTGYLSARAGVISLRYHAQRDPDYQFFDPARGTFSWLQRAIDRLPLSADDITGMDDEDGWCWLHIGRGQVSVTIGCEDKSALRSALDRFRGAA